MKKDMMNDRIIKLLKEIASNEGKVINNLIKANVFTTDYIVNSAIEYDDNRIMYFVAKYVEGINVENINRLAEKVKVADLGFRRNYDIIYWFAKEVKNAPVDLLADGLIIALKNSQKDGSLLADILAYIYKFCKDVKNAPIKKFADALINLRWPFAMLEFAKNVKKAPIRELALGIIETKSAEIMYLFARDIKSKKVPMDELIDALIKTKSAEYIYQFARDVKGAPIDRLEDGIIRSVENSKNKMIESNKVGYICDFARNIKGANISKIEDALIKLGESNYIERLVSIKGTDNDKLIDELIKISDPYDIYFLAKYKKGNIYKLAKGIVQTGSAEYMYQFAKDIENAPIELLADGIIATGNAKYMYDFIVKVKGAPIDRLVEAIMNTRNVGYMKIVQTYLRDKKEYIINQEKIDSTERLLKEEKEMFTRLINLANLGEVEKIQNDATLYRNLFIDEYIENSQNSVKTRRLVCENNGDK